MEWTLPAKKNLFFLFGCCIMTTARSPRGVSREDVQQVRKGSCLAKTAATEHGGCAILPAMPSRNNSHSLLVLERTEGNKKAAIIAKGVVCIALLGSAQFTVIVWLCLHSFDWFWCSYVGNTSYIRNDVCTTYHLLYKTVELVYGRQD